MWGNTLGDPYDEYTKVKNFSNVDVDSLPISQSLHEKLLLLEEFQGSLNWYSPLDATPWSKEKYDYFVCCARIVFEELRQELDEEYEIVDLIDLSNPYNSK